MGRRAGGRGYTFDSGVIHPRGRMCRRFRPVASTDRAVPAEELVFGAPPAPTPGVQPVMNTPMCRVLAAALTLGSAASQPIPTAAVGDALVWYLPTTDGAARLFVCEKGLGPPVVVLHGGWGAEHSYLVDAVAGLEGQFRFVHYDQRGSLRSPAPVASISVEQHVADLEQLRVALGLEQLDLFAHSMGSMLAMCYLEAHPDRVRSLTLLAPVLPCSPQNAAEGAAEEDMQRRARALSDREAVHEELRRLGLDGDGLTARQRTIAWRVRFAGVNLADVRGWRRLGGGQVFYDAAAGKAAGDTMPEDYDFRPALAALEDRCTVLVGDHDFVDLGAERLRATYGALERAHFTVLAHAGHCPWIDRPQATRRLLAAALRRGTRTGGDLSSQETVPAEILVMGTQHLGYLRDRLEPGDLDTTLALLEAWAPTAICVEALPSHEIASLIAMGESGQPVVDAFAATQREVGRLAQERGEQTWASASSSLQQSPRLADGATTGERRARVGLLLAAYELETAVLEWSRLAAADRVADRLLPERAVEVLNAYLGSSNETVRLGVELARRLQLSRLWPIDEHRSSLSLAAIAGPLMQQIEGHPALAEMRRSSFFDDAKAALESAVERDDLLPFYRRVNAQGHAAEDERLQWDLFLRTRLPSGLDLARLSLWRARNLRMAASIAEAAAEHPGGRVLVIVGSGHKAILERSLRLAPSELRVVSWTEMAEAARAAVR